MPKVTLVTLEIEHSGRLSNDQVLEWLLELIDESEAIWDVRPISVEDSPRKVGE